MRLPDYAGPMLTLQPPFQFSNVTVSVFPLRAQLDTLQRFCDAYLNVVPPEVGYFRASMPYVYLMLLDYGRLAAQAANFGAFSQREAMFFVPLEWYKLVDQRWLFHDWASVSPFIYVDGEISLSLGRTVMGWPKSLVNLTPKLTGWIEDPDGSTTDVALSAQVFPHAYSGARMEERMILRVRSPMPSRVRFPFDANGSWLPWTLWANLADNMSKFAGDCFGMLRGMGVAPPNAALTRENLQRKLQRSASAAWQSAPWAPRLTFNSITLKQFRRADHPTKYCYQSLNNSPLSYTSLNRGGLLGSGPSDPSGGYVVELAEWPNFPIVSTLGLSADRIVLEGAPTIASMKPVFPFWYNVNMEYEATENLAARGEDGVWFDGSGRRCVQQPVSQTDLFFNTATGAASPVVTGPFRFDSATVRVFPLLARREKLRALLDQVLNAPLNERSGLKDSLVLWTDDSDDEENPFAYVYLTLVDWGDVSSKTNSIGDWADSSLTFYVPIKRSVDGLAVSGGLFPAFTFSSSSLHACTLQELFGVPTVQAEFIEPERTWADPTPGHVRKMLEIKAELLPSLYEGQMAETGPILSLIEHADEPLAAPSEPSQRSQAFAQALARESARKTALSPADAKQLDPGEQYIEGAGGPVNALLSEGSPLHVYTMKQFRDATQMDKACYQALVRIPYAIDELHKLAPHERPVSVNIHQRVMFPIVETLGLVEQELTVSSGDVIYSMRAVSPFVMRGNITMGDGEQLYWRTGMDWQPDEASDTKGLDVKPVKLDEPQPIIERLAARLSERPPPPPVVDAEAKHGSN